MVGRIPVLDVTPVVEHGRYPAKSVIGESFEVTALVFREGHDQLGADVVLTDPTGVRHPRVRMRPVPRDVDRWGASVCADQMGHWQFAIESWSHPLATWQHDAGIKIRAGVDVELMFREGADLLARWGREVQAPKESRTVVLDAISGLTDETRPIEARLAAGESQALTEAIETYPLRDLLSTDGPYPLVVDRERALYGSWYEFFPRSEGALRHDDGTVTPGTLRTAAERLDAVAAMGFDIIYLPPIHPIGTVNRKGRNNTLTPSATDVGSPWAIGSAAGGHDKVNPELGTLKDFDAFVKRAGALGLEVALDLALQAAPDHPWVAAHPEWFTTRADGTIAYAENPPKKYQDIYPVNFDNDPEGIYTEVLRVVRHWMKHGVRIFRVDNPHTKPVAFWERLLSEVRESDPDVLFLAEAFTKPPMMQTLAKVGFHQSYTYFTWRNNRADIESYLRELSVTSGHYFRPNFWPNTPDILHEYLQHGGPEAFRIRATLAATGSPSWGVYAGFELYERMAVRPGSEEYLDSEKYEVKVRDWASAEADGRSMAPYLTRLNQLRREHPALQQLRSLTVHASDNDNILVFSKHATAADGSRDLVIVVLTLDPHTAQETMIHLDVAALGLPENTRFDVRDELTGQSWLWSTDNYIRLDPAHEVAHILSVRTA